jgi:hypothetical protein
LREFSEARRKIPRDLPSQNAEFQPSMEELLCDARGCNGKWKERKAKDELARRMRLAEELEREHRRAQECRHSMNLENDTLFKRQVSWEQKEIAAQVAEKRRVEEEALARELEAQEAERRQRQLELPEPPQFVPCDRCRASGTCKACAGSGETHAFFLTPMVSGTSQGFRGRARYGCECCGGVRGEDDALETPGRRKAVFRRGTGRCSACDGAGQVERRQESGPSNRERGGASPGCVVLHIARPTPVPNL